MSEIPDRLDWSTADCHLNTDGRSLTVKLFDDLDERGCRFLQEQLNVRIPAAMEQARLFVELAWTVEPGSPTTVILSGDHLFDLDPAVIRDALEAAVHTVRQKIRNDQKITDEVVGPWLDQLRALARP